MDNVLQDTSRDMREQADAVDVAFQRRVEEVQDAKNKLEENLRNVRTPPIVNMVKMFPHGTGRAR